MLCPLAWRPIDQPAIWVTRETERVMRHGAPLHNLISVNRSVMQGLCPQEAG